MNILQLRTEFSDNGPGTQTLTISTELRSRGYKVVLASSGGHLTEKIINAGFSEIENINFMNCVHPNLYDLKCGNGIGLKMLLKELIPTTLRAIKRRII